jgi:hypothetical protein
MNQAAKVRVLLVMLVVLITALMFGTGCNQSSDQGQALEEQRQKNKELQKELDAQKEKQEAAKQEEMEQQIADLEKKVEEKESEPQQTSQPEQQSNPQPEVVIDSNSDWTAPPSQAAEGVVVVAPDYNVGAVTTEEAEVINAAINYYQYAEIGDYYTTHSLLSTDDQAMYPVDVWVQANTVLDSAAGEFVVTDAYPEDVGNGYPTYAVLVTVYMPDGSTFNRKTYFTNQGNGFWAHWLSQEEMDLFNGAL